MAELKEDLYGEHLIYKDFNIPLTIVNKKDDPIIMIQHRIRNITKREDVSVPITSLVLNNQCNLVRERFEMFKHTSLVDFEKMLNLFYNQKMYGKLTDKMLSIIREVYLDSRQQSFDFSKNFDDKTVKLLIDSVPDKNSSIELQRFQIPDKLVLYRGEDINPQSAGLSWTTDDHIAFIFSREHPHPNILKQEFTRDQILSVYKDDNSEHEVIVNPKCIKR